MNFNIAELKLLDTSTIPFVNFKNIISNDIFLHSNITQIIVYLPRQYKFKTRVEKKIK